MAATTSNGVLVERPEPEDGDPLCTCVFQLPRSYNDGVPVEREAESLIFDMLNQWFGGWTDLGTCKGCWQGVKERSRRIEVTVPRSRVRELRTLVHLFGQHIRQQEMYFTVTKAEAELIRVSG